MASIAQPVARRPDHLFQVQLAQSLRLHELELTEADLTGLAQLFLDHARSLFELPPASLAHVSILTRTLAQEAAMDLCEHFIHGDEADNDV